MTNNEPLEMYVSLGYSTPGKTVPEENMERFAAELHETGVVKSIKYVASDVINPNAKGLGIDFNTLLIKIAEAGAISSIFTVIGNWLSKDNNREVNITVGKKQYIFKNPTKEQQEQLVKIALKLLQEDIDNGKKARTPHR